MIVIFECSIHFNGYENKFKKKKKNDYVTKTVSKIKSDEITLEELSCSIRIKRRKYTELGFDFERYYQITIKRKLNLRVLSKPIGDRSIS